MVAVVFHFGAPAARACGWSGSSAKQEAAVSTQYRPARAPVQALTLSPIARRAEPRRVQPTIYTPDDLDFTDISLTAGGSLTSTDHHPLLAGKSPNLG
ncbi:hypothetical protein [Kitasatospora sp. NPDC098663]|uniref:hypothetical protein n=1 Tax=Kitasatospora sp. NPDC098663 TaxID=3364096 RepID=UPI0037F5A740